MAYNWKQITKRIPIKASAKSIFDTLVMPQGLGTGSGYGNGES